ncbi:MAG: hypothetical protein CVT48_01750 [Thermoplasmata archaeon HGW-Thermoplasmata-1]|nr:MAG: hypothetical protein CVT48_01750 [Thermoplasmata archaeon HGW-Thermoplasmata-1]
MKNPFDYQRIARGKSFVNREKELEMLIEAVRHRENILLHSPRRLGKSSLLKKVLDSVKNEKIAIYVDLWECSTESEIAENIVSGIVNAAYGKIEKAAVALREWITSARPLLTLEPDGKIGVKLDSVEKEKTLRESLEMIQKMAEKRGKDVVVVLDECQSISEFRGHRVEKILRSVMQDQDMVSYLLSGSKQHLLEAMVNEKTRPFYKQLRSVTLGPVPIGSFIPFIKESFSDVGGVTDEAISEIYRFTDGNPQRTQQVCHRLYSTAAGGGRVTPESVGKAVMTLCGELDGEFNDDLDAVKNKRQRQILKGLALEPHGKPLSGDFIGKYELGSASSVQIALAELIKKGILDRNYGFVDPLFRTWLEFRQRNLI